MEERMRLSQEQLDEFQRVGYLFFPSTFTKDEIRSRY